MRDHERVVAAVRKGPRNIIRIIVSERNGEKFVTLRKLSPNGKGVFLQTGMVLRLVPTEANQVAAALIEASKAEARK